MAIDTQSDISLIREDLLPPVGPLSNPDAMITITGITQDSITTRGLGHYDLSLDNVLLRGVQFFAMPKAMMSTQLWLGKNVLDDPQISVVLHGSSATFLERSTLAELPQIQDFERPRVELRSTVR